MNWIYVSNVIWPHITIDNGMPHGTEAQPCHECDVLVHCLAGRQSHLRQCCKSLEQFLHQQHFSVILPVDFRTRFSENKVTDLLKVGCMHRSWLSLMYWCYAAWLPPVGIADHLVSS